MKLSIKQIKEFANYLCREEKSAATQEKYLRDAQVFCVYAHGQEITKELVVAWKKNLVEQGYAVQSINSMLASINSLLDFMDWSRQKEKPHNSHYVVNHVIFLRGIWEVVFIEYNNEQHKYALLSNMKNLGL